MDPDDGWAETLGLWKLLAKMLEMLVVESMESGSLPCYWKDQQNIQVFSLSFDCHIFHSFPILLNPQLEQKNMY